VVEVLTGEANKVDVFYCAVASFEAGGAAMMTTRAVEIMDVFLKGYRWKFTYYVRNTSATNEAVLGVGYSKLPCGECEVPPPAGVLMTRT
jgi:hypothetical protein